MRGKIPEAEKYVENVLLVPQGLSRNKGQGLRKQGAVGTGPGTLWEHKSQHPPPIEPQCYRFKESEGKVPIGCPPPSFPPHTMEWAAGGQGERWLWQRSAHPSPIRPWIALLPFYASILKPPSSAIGLAFLPARVVRSPLPLLPKAPPPRRFVWKWFFSMG